MILSIESVKPTAKSLVLKAGGKEYFAKKDSGISQGMTIDAETKASDYNGKTYVWVEKWKPATAATQTQAGTSGPALGSAAAFMPFVSNTVAHAISAGLITAPNQIAVWANAAYVAAVRLGEDVPF